MTAAGIPSPRSNAELRNERLERSRKNGWLALLIFAAPLLGFLVNFVLILKLVFPWGLPLAVSGAWFTGMLFIVGHDACHQSYTSSRWLNGILGRIALLPSLHSFSLWDIGHNRTHHRYNNVRGFDYVWEPLSPADYSVAKPLKRVWYRFLRSPAGVFAYYLFHIWPQKMFLLRQAVYRNLTWTYFLDGLLVWGFLAFELVFAIALGLSFGRSAAEAVLMAVILPFLIWNALMSFVVYLHHTHPDVPWYSSMEEWRAGEGGVRGTVHVRFPWLLRKLMLDIMEHNAHHFAPGVPLYHLAPMQESVKRESADAFVDWDWSVQQFLRVTGRCKLYDFEGRRWVEFPRALVSTI